MFTFHPDPYHSHYAKLLRELKPAHPYRLRCWIQDFGKRTIKFYAQNYPSMSHYEALKTEYPRYINGTSHIACSFSYGNLQRDVDTVFNEYQKQSEYSEDDPDVLFDEGLDAFFTKHLGIPLNPLNMMIVAYIFQSKKLGEISRLEFTAVCNTYRLLKVESFTGFMKLAVTHLTSPEIWLRDLYIAAFLLANDGHVMNTLSLPKAISVWNQIFPLFPNFKTFKDIVAWLKESQKVESVTRDFFLNLYDFGLAMADDYETNYKFDQDDGWNSLLDQFVLDFLDLEVVKNTIDPSWY